MTPLPLDKTHPIFGEVKQIAYVTDDIEKTASAWASMAGVAPWLVMKNVALPAVHNGEDVTINIDVALAYQGDTQIELIKPLDDGPSPYQENVRAKLWGLHHLQFACEDMGTALEAAKDNGLEAACIMDASAGGRYAYIKGPGIWFEVMESNGSLDTFFGSIKTACQNWDGETLFTG